MPQEPQKRLLIKLGTRCNLACPHCHQVQKNFKEHPRLLRWIEENNFNRITFSGGEPLMYFDTIKRYMTVLGHDKHYRMMSNATLLNKEIAEFLNDYKVTFGVSYDGECGGRDLAVPIQWDALHHLKSWGMCTIFSDPKMTFRDFFKDASAIFKKHKLKYRDGVEFMKINWIHQTKDAPNEEFTKEVADRYIEEVTLQLDKTLFCYSQDGCFDGNLKNLIGRWYAKPSFKHGVLCCNEKLTSVNLDGTIMLCPYGTMQIGTIDEMPSIDTLDSFSPEKCKGCEHWEICRCSCVASVTELDCYVNRSMIPKVKELIKRHGVEDKIRELFGA